MRDKVYAVDLETTGLNCRLDRIVGVSIASEQGSMYYVDINDPEVIAIITNPENILVFHNAVFDISFIINKKIKLSPNIRDTMIMAHLHNPDRPSLGLKDLSNELLGEDSIKCARELWAWLSENSLSKEDISKAPEEMLAAYAREDAINTRNLFFLLHEKLAEMGSWLQARGFTKTPLDYYNEEALPMIPVICAMQNRGIKLDLEGTAAKKIELLTRIRELEEQLNQKVPEKEQVEKRIFEYKKAERIAKNKTGKLKKDPPRVRFNWGSETHIKSLFFETFREPVRKKTAKGNPSIDAEVLEPMQQKYPWVADLLEFKELKKLVSTYLSNLLDLQQGGVIHASFNITGTTTGRLSSNKPNLQNLPRFGNIKSLFVPRPNQVFVYADYSQLELRVAAHLSRDPLMISEYNKERTGGSPDLHTETAELLGIDRQQGKTINFAIIYNASGFRIAQILGYLAGVNMGDKEAVKAQVRRGDEVQQKLFGKYKGLAKYVDEQKRKMLQYTMTISHFGNIRRLPELHSDVRSKYNHALKAGFNLPIQGFGASLCKRAMIALNKRKYHIVNQIHDAIVIETTKDNAESCVNEVRSIMESVYELVVPLKAEPKILTSLEE